MNKITQVGIEKVFVCPSCGGAKKVNSKDCSLCEGTGIVTKASSPKEGDSFTK